MFRPGGQICGWGYAGERAEIMDKMRLIEISAGSSQICPIDRAATIYLVQCLLEPADTAKHFGRKPDLIAKQLDEAA